jgi:hypothetical protein
MVTELLTRSRAAQNGSSPVWFDAPKWRRRYAYRLVILNWESLGLDPYHVQTWSLTADLSIKARTVRAVVAKDGAV